MCIRDRLNKSVKDIAYNIIDLDGTPQASLIDQIRGLEGVINVRVISSQSG